MNKTFDEMCNALSKTSLSVPDRMIAVNGILDRFEVTPKPVVSALDLGKMVQIAYKHEAYTTEHIGERMLDQLASAGLEIVEASDE